LGRPEVVHRRERIKQNKKKGRGEKLGIAWKFRPKRTKKREKNLQKPFSIGIIATFETKTTVEGEGHEVSQRLENEGETF